MRLIIINSTLNNRFFNVKMSLYFGAVPGMKLETQLAAPLLLENFEQFIYFWNLKSFSHKSFTEIQYPQVFWTLIFFFCYYNPGKPWNSFLTLTYIGGRQKKSWAFPILSDFVTPSAFGECKSAFHNVYVQCTTRGHKTLLYINRSVYQLAP